MNEPLDNVWLEARAPALRGPRVSYEELRQEDTQYAWLYRGVLFTGVAYELRPDGSLASIDEFIDGLRSGLGREWHTNGKLSMEGFLWIGRRHGEVREWDAAGRLRHWGWSEYGVPLEWKKWDEHGRVTEHWTLPRDRPLWELWELERDLLLEGNSPFPPLPPRPNAPVLPGDVGQRDA